MMTTLHTHPGPAPAPDPSPERSPSPFARYLTLSHCGADRIAQFLGALGTAQLYFVSRHARRLWPLGRRLPSSGRDPNPSAESARFSRVEWLAHPLLFREYMTLRLAVGEGDADLVRKLLAPLMATNRVGNGKSRQNVVDAAFGRWCPIPMRIPTVEMYALLEELLGPECMMLVVRDSGMSDKVLDHQLTGPNAK